MRFHRSIGLLFLTCLGCQVSSAKDDTVLPGVDAVVFAKRAYLQESGEHDVAGGAGQVIDYQRYNPGGGVFVLTPPSPDGELRELTRDFKGVDIAGLDLSFDGKEVVFAMRRDGDANYHLYKAKIDGKSATQAADVWTARRCAADLRAGQAHRVRHQSRLTPRWARAPTSTTTVAR